MLQILLIFMKKIFLFLFFASYLMACEAQPEPIKYGKDACHLCKMTLMDKRFGAEILTKKGKVYKFDDLNCLVNFLKSKTVKEEQIAKKLAVDFSSSEFVEVEKAFFYHSSVSFRSPMRADVATFADKKTAEKTVSEIKEVRELHWKDLESLFK